MKTKTYKYSLIRLSKIIFSSYKVPVLISIFCIIFTSIAGSVSTIFLKQIIDKCIIPGLASGFNSVKDEFKIIMAERGIAAIVSFISTLTYAQIITRISKYILRDFRQQMFSKMQKFPVEYFDRNSHGKIMSTYINDIDTLRQVIEENFPIIIESSVSIMIIFSLMLTYSLYLSVIIIIMLFIMGVLIKTTGIKTAKGMVNLQETFADEEGYIEEMLEGQKIIKSFAREEKAISEFMKCNKNLYSISSKNHGKANALMPILANIGNLTYVLLSIVGALFLYFNIPNLTITGNHSFTFGILLSFLGMSHQISRTVGNAVMQMNMLALGSAGCKRIFALLDNEVEIDDGKITIAFIKYDEKGNVVEYPQRTGIWAWKIPNTDGTYTYRELKGNLEFINVTFGYEKNKIILKNVSFYAHPGQKIAFVGPTGAGKTTITNLANRFYEINEGKILFDGINVKDIKKIHLRRSLGLVLQDVNLFSGTILENINYGRLSATREECVEAAKIANAHSFIEKLPNGYDTYINGNKSGLSQGQKQLISIARAAVATPPAMILDEATSSIDTYTEKLVQDGMDTIMRGKSVFAIAHRLSTIKNSNAIMVMDKGEIIERGSHKELYEQKGIYYKLCTGALELE